MSEWLGIGALILSSGFLSIFALWPIRKHYKVWFTIPVIMGAVGVGYWYWGAGLEYLEFLQRHDRQQTAAAMIRRVKNPELLVNTLKKHLVAHPNSARGWYLLGRLYSSQRNWEAAHPAFAKAYALNPHDDLIAVNYAQSLFARQHPEDDESARVVLKAILQEHPQQGDALMLLALDAQRRHSISEALTYWRRLLILVPNTSPESQRIRKIIQDLQTQ